jgi:hypothetical protein
MTTIRHWTGIAFVITATALAEMSHRFIHIGAWLTDQEEILDDCPNCQAFEEERDGY